MTPTRSTPRPAPAPTPFTVLLADVCPVARKKLQTALASLGPQTVSEVTDGDELERTFFREGPFDLVVCKSLLGARSGLHVLARARSAGRKSAFIIYSSLDTSWMRVFVSDSEGTVLSSRVVSLEGLAQIASGMLAAAR